MPYNILRGRGTQCRGKNKIKIGEKGEILRFYSLTTELCKRMDVPREDHDILEELSYITF